MMRRFGFILGAAMLVALAVPTAAQAADEDYPPVVPTTPSLAGSTAVGYCEVDAPWIEYSVTLTDPDNQVTTRTATLTLTDGTNSTEPIELGELQNNQLSGRVLWPGASLDDAGRADGWPGWTSENGQLVRTPDNFAWTRGAITGEIRVNPDLAVAIAYPAASAECADPPVAGAASLPATGVSEYVLPLGIAGGAAALAGAVLLIARRRRTDV